MSAKVRRQTSLGLSLALALLFIATPRVAGQLPPATPPATTQTPDASTPPPRSSTSPSSPVSEQEDVVRITTNLVQVDVVVLDKDGRQVTDLRPEDFVIEEDGRPQEITNFSYVSNETGVRSVQRVAAAAADKSAPVVPVRLRPEQVRRTIALVADDLGTSFESMGYVRRAMKKFVDEQMRPDDLIAIIRTRSGSGALQFFTSDKQQLHAAIERVKFNPVAGRAGISAFEFLQGDPLHQIDPRLQRAAGSAARRGDDTRNRRTSRAEIDEFRDNIFTYGTLGALNLIVRDLNELPGRKSLVMFSDGLPLFDPNDSLFNENMRTGLRRLTDLANRGSVVIYTIDARGVPYIGATTASGIGILPGADTIDALNALHVEVFNSQHGLHYLADQTGGFFVRNNNDLGDGLQRVLDDQKGYYLIGYRPDPSTFEQSKGRGRFHKVVAKVKRPSLKSRTRNGFFGFTDGETRPPKNTRFEQIGAALLSPFASRGVPLRLTPVFSREGAKNSVVDTMLHIDTRGFTFTEEADGWRKAVFDVVALALGDRGTIVDEVNRTETLRVRGEGYEQVLRDGLVYSLRMPVKQAGAYQLRIAVRDAASARVGAARQFIRVPNLDNDHLALSGLLMMGTEHAAPYTTTASNSVANMNVAAGDASGRTATTTTTPDARSSPAVRRFRRGAEIDYFFDIYNAKTTRDTARPRLLIQTRLFRDGEQILAGQPTPFNAGSQSNLKHLRVAARMQLGADLPAGEYVFQIVVTDQLADEKRRLASQWIDFEVVK